MKMCQYEFEFPHEYFFDIEPKIYGILGFVIAKEDYNKQEFGREKIYEFRKDSNLLIFVYYEITDMYLMIVRTDDKYASNIEEMLKRVCNKIEDDYGEDHSKTIKNVINERHTNLEEIRAEYGLTI